MNELDFTLELNSDYLGNEEADELFVQAEDRLKQLAAGHTDLVGAAVTLRRPASGETAYLHEATVVVYGRPDHIAATAKEDNAELALKHALDAAERQIRQRREKLKKRWEQPGNDPVDQEVAELIAADSAVIQSAIEAPSEEET